MTREQWNMVSFEHGTLAVIVRDDRICRVCYTCSPDEVFALLKRLYPEAEQSSLPVIEDGLSQLREYFQGKRRHFELPLCDDSLSDFACKVHQELLQVPYGAVVTYGDLAARAGSPRAARAVGRVMSSNPFPLIVPCHRVVNADGRLGQYSAASGTSTKAWLIDFEKSRSNS